MQSLAANNGRRASFRSPPVSDIYIWIGPKSEIGERKKAARCAIELASLLPRHASAASVAITRIAGGNEPAAFVKLWEHGTHRGSAFRVISGGAADAFDPARPSAFKRQLLHVSRGSSADSVTSARKIPAQASQMNSGDCYILNAGEQVVAWFGPGASGFERAEAAKIARDIAQRQDNAEVILIESRLVGNDDGSQTATRRRMSSFDDDGFAAPLHKEEEEFFFERIEGDERDVQSEESASAAAEVLKHRRAAAKNSLLRLEINEVPGSGGNTSSSECCATYIQHGVNRLDVSLMGRHVFPNVSLYSNVL